MKTPTLSALALISALSVLNPGTATSNELFYNYDGWNLFYYGADDAAIAKNIAPLVTNGVTAVMLSPNVGQTFVCAPGVHLEMFNGGTNLSDSEAAAFPCFAGPYTTMANNVVQRWTTEGIDPFAVAVATVKSNGLKAFLSFRMNDNHALRDATGAPCPDPAYTDAFWRNHPQFQTTLSANSPTLDFSYLEVRQYRVDQIHELLDRYPVDGVELDFLRSYPYFNTADAAAYTTNMTDFVYRMATVVASLSNTSGRQLKLLVRVPQSMAACSLLGLDPIGWAHNQYIDGIILGRWLRLSPDLDVEAFKRAAPQVPVYASLDYIMSYPCFSCQPRPANHRLATPEAYRGIASALYARGADGIYLFNMYATRTDDDPHLEPFAVLPQLRNPPLLQNSDRLFPAIARDDIDLGFENRPTVALPGTVLPNAFPLEAELDVGDVNTNATDTLRLIGPSLASYTFIAELNGRILDNPLTPAAATLFPEQYNGIQPALTDCVDFAVPSDFLFAGRNVVIIHTRPAQVTINGIELASHAPQQPVPLIVGFEYSSGKVRVSFAGIPGLQYQLQRSSDLTTWVRLDTVLLSEGAPFTFVDSTPTNYPGFYRIALLP
jgi:hypothetical protein